MRKWRNLTIIGLIVVFVIQPFFALQRTTAAQVFTFNIEIQIIEIVNGKKQGLQGAVIQFDTCEAAGSNSLISEGYNDSQNICDQIQNKSMPNTDGSGMTSLKINSDTRPEDTWFDARVNITINHPRMNPRTKNTQLEVIKVYQQNTVSVTPKQITVSTNPQPSPSPTSPGSSPSPSVSTPLPSPTNPTVTPGTTNTGNSNNQNGAKFTDDNEFVCLKGYFEKFGGGWTGIFIGTAVGIATLGQVPAAWEAYCNAILFMSNSLGKFACFMIDNFVDPIFLEKGQPPTCPLIDQTPEQAAGLKPAATSTDSAGAGGGTLPGDAPPVAPTVIPAGPKM